MDKIWLKNYPADVPEFIDDSNYETILDIIEKSCKAHSDSTAFVNMGTSISFNELEIQSRNFASYLQNELKLKPGDSCAVMMPNLIQYPVALFGILRAGLIAINVNPLYTKRELAHQLRDSKAKMIITIKNFAANVEKVLPETEVKHVILSDIGDHQAMPKRMLVNFAIKYVKKLIPAYHLPNAISYRDVLKHGANSTYARPECKGSDIAYLQYTGGTTGVAKGAILTHKNIVANVLQVFYQFSPRTLLSDDKVVTPLPLYHIFANSVSLMFIMMIGGQNLLITNPRDMDSFIKDLKSYPFTIFFGLNTLFKGLLKNDKFKEIDFSSARFTIAGGMGTEESIAREWQSVTSMPVIEGYGLTECSPVVCSGVHTQQEYTAGIGLPLPSTEVRIVNDAQEPLDINEVGELQIRGPQVMEGYWLQPEATSKAINEDGWFSSGDIAKMDENGCFTIVDRKKDMILISGFNVYPSEIEEVLTLHPDIDEAAAIGIPDDNVGEAVKVFVCTTNNNLTKEAIIAHCREHLTGYKVPKNIAFRDTLPKSNVGKILKRELA